MANNIHLEPRISILEKGQESLQRDLSNLASSVERQGTHLEHAIGKLNDSFSTISERITSAAKTDWQTVLTLIGIIIIVLGAVMTPVWLSLNNTNTNVDRNYKLIEVLQTEQHENIRINTIVEYHNKRLDLIESKLENMWSNQDHLEYVQNVKEYNDVLIATRQQAKQTDENNAMIQELKEIKEVLRAYALQHAIPK
jgi:hypothetical protein